MKKKTLVILFANDTIISVFPTKMKALLPIGNIPCISICIKSFTEAIKDNIDFILITAEDVRRELETEIIRWHPSEEDDNIQFFFHPVKKCDHRYASVFGTLLKDQISEDYSSVIISDCSFPLLGNQIVKMFLEQNKDCCSAMIGNFLDKKFALSRRLLEGVTLSSEHTVEFPALSENNKTFPYYFMNTVCLPFQAFRNYFSGCTEDKNYYHCLTWDAFQIPTYFMKFECVPFMLCNDRIYLDNLYWKKKNVEHLQYINNMWMKWNNVSTRLGTIEKKIENMKSTSKPRTQQKK